jgi:hypothetical protein
LEIIHDKNALWFSLNLYRFMWIHDHYEYYMRIATKEGGHLSYPIKRIEVLTLFNLGNRVVSSGDEEDHQNRRKSHRTAQFT